MYFGAHFSIQGGYHIAAEKANEMGCTTLQIFTRSSRIWKAKSMNPDAASKFKEAIQKSGLKKPVVHLPYLPNFATDDPTIYEKSNQSLKEEIQRCGLLGIQLLVVHVGSHKGKGVATGIKNVVKHLDSVNDVAAENKVYICLETSAGTKNSTGSKFEEIGSIIQKTSDDKMIGVCFDTAHIFAAGYDIRTPESVERTITEFENEIGLKRLKVVHCNDSKFELGSGKDRHEHIGLGNIGEKGFKAFFSNSRIKKLEVPVILETPIDEKGTHETDFKKLKEIVGF